MVNTCSPKVSFLLVLFNFTLFKRIDILQLWEEAPSDVYFAMKVTVKIMSKDSLKRSSGLIVAKMNPDQIFIEGRPMPNLLLAFVKDSASKDLC